MKSIKDHQPLLGPRDGGVEPAGAVLGRSIDPGDCGGRGDIRRTRRDRAGDQRRGRAMKAVSRSPICVEELIGIGERLRASVLHIRDAVNFTDQEGITDERIEEYLHEAVVSWLPQTFPESHASTNSHAPKALFFFGGAFAAEARRPLAD